jgi:branched-chain amino acid transport system permease protein
MMLSIGRVEDGRRLATAVATVAAVVVLTAAPLLGASVYAIVVLTSLLGYALLAMSINLVAGHAGLLTLAHAAYAGVGAYAVVIVSREWSSSAWVQLAAALVAGALVAGLTGWIVTHASKVYFLMLSLAIGELLHLLALQWRSVTSGSDGLSAGKPFEVSPGNPVLLAGHVYWVALAVFLVCAGLVLVLIRSPFGSALRGIRDNEPRMRSLGYPTAHYKYVVWVFSGAVSGAAGWILVAQLPRFVAPAQLGFQAAALILLAVIVGGLGSMWGACLGATLMVVMSDVVSQDLDGRGPLALGIMFVLAVYLLPRGIAGVVASRSASSPAEQPNEDGSFETVDFVAQGVGTGS